MQVWESARVINCHVASLEEELINSRIFTYGLFESYECVFWFANIDEQKPL